MNRLTIFAVAAILPVYAMAGGSDGGGGAPPTMSVDEPSLVGLLVLGAAVVGALKLRAKFKK